MRTLYSRNITPAAIGQWTDGELIRAITAGVNKNGEPLFPIMPYPRYAKMSRDDVESIVAYVRTLAPVDYTAPPRDLAMPLPLVVRTIPKAPEFRPISPRTDRVPTANTSPTPRPVPNVTRRWSSRPTNTTR